MELPLTPKQVNSITDIYSIESFIKSCISSLKKILLPLVSDNKTETNIDEPSPSINAADFNSTLYYIRSLINEKGDRVEELKRMSGETLLDEVLVKVHSDIENAKKRVDKREIQLLDSILIRVFNDRVISEKFNVYERGAYVTNRNINRLMNIRTVEQVLYMDTPMAIGLQNPELPYWRNLNETLKIANNSFVSDTPIEQILSNDILRGNVSFDEKVLDRFTYKRADGLEINLLECATGSKSFAALQLLLKNGFFNNKTLLMIDEPEAHLHPQWIVEFARMIVLLNKELGVKFFIASHSPDMISALKYISEKEGITPKLNFYLAEKKNPTDFTYTYRALGTNIDDIYASFNIAFDKIDLYGTVDDEVL